MPAWPIPVRSITYLIWSMKSSTAGHAPGRYPQLPTDEGSSVTVPGLPGCWSEGATEAEAPANFRAAIEGYLSVRDDLTPTP